VKTVRAIAQNFQNRNSGIMPLNSERNRATIKIAELKKVRMTSSATWRSSLNRGEAVIL